MSAPRNIFPPHTDVAMLSSGAKDLVYAAALVLIGVAVYYGWRYYEVKHNYTVSTAVANPWVASADTYACPSSYTTAGSAGAPCVLPKWQAVKACATDAKCMGYLDPSTATAAPSAWTAGNMQLVGVAPATSTTVTGATYYAKKAAASS